MAITLRLDSGSALSYAQVDTNFTSMFYSASYSGSTVTFFRTGSTALGIPNTSSSFNVGAGSGADTLWTASIDRISRLGRVDVTGSFINGTSNSVVGTFSHAEGGGKTGQYGYLISGLYCGFIFNDKSWTRDYLINKILENDTGSN